MAQIFLSYSNKDVARAESLARALAGHGWTVWWDRHIPPGKSFDDVIEQALDAAQCVIVLWSQASVGSNWVKSEAGEGARRGVLIPVALEDVKPPLEFRRIETANLSDWEEGKPSPEFDVLLKAVGTQLGEVAAAPRPAEPAPLPRAAKPAADAPPGASRRPATATSLRASLMVGIGLGACAGLLSVAAWAAVSQPVPWVVVFGLPLLGGVVGGLAGWLRHGAAFRASGAASRRN